LRKNHLNLSKARPRATDRRRCQQYLKQPQQRLRLRLKLSRIGCVILRLKNNRNGCSASPIIHRAPQAIKLLPNRQSRRLHPIWQHPIG
jgi:hypothetical protein